MSFSNITVVNVNYSHYDTYIGRGSIFGNPFIIGVDGSRSDVLMKYMQYAISNKTIMSQLYTLDNKILGCHCKPKKCHGDILKMLRDKQLTKEFF